MKSKSRILVTGANGQLGKELKNIAHSFPQYEFTFLSKEDLPVHHFELVRIYFNTLKPDFCINCAAYTAVDRAEEEKVLAFQVNGEAVGVLAAICKEKHSKFLHISTDYVFDGKENKPYSENFPTHPLNIYGASKLEGEKQAIQLNPEAVIIRTSWLYSAYGKNFVKTMMKLLTEKTDIRVVNDQFGSPTYAADLAETIMKIISSNEWIPGIFHFSNEGVISWYDFATGIKEITKSNGILIPVTTSEFPSKAGRPMFSALDKTKIQGKYHIQLKNWKESLSECIMQIEKHS